jgi:hypothetical protein
MKFRAKRQQMRTMTPEEERDLLARQRDALLAWLSEWIEKDRCPLVEAKEVFGFFLRDPADGMPLQGDMGDALRQQLDDANRRLWRRHLIQD